MYTKPPNKYASLDKFFLGPTLGEGASAKVKIAHCSVTGKQFAIKILNKSKPNFNQKLFLREVELMSFVQHKNVPTLIGYYESIPYIKKNGQSYEVAAIVMEYLPNGELFNYIKLGGAFHEDIARTCFKTLIETMEDIHNKGIAHRDLKPENLFFDEEFNLKVGDFGLAGQFKNEKGFIPLYEECGSQGTMAPEVYQKSESSSSSKSVYNGSIVDIFSCGTILFCLVVGCPPFVAAKPKKDYLYTLIATGNYAAFWEFFETRLKRTFSDEFKDLINAMLAFAPYERPTIQQIKDHPWYNGTVLNSEEMKEALSELGKKVNAQFWKERKDKKEAKAKAKAEMMMILQEQKMKVSLGFTGIQVRK